MVEVKVKVKANVKVKVKAKPKKKALTVAQKRLMRDLKKLAKENTGNLNTVLNEALSANRAALAAAEAAGAAAGEAASSSSGAHKKTKKDRGVPKGTTLLSEEHLEAAILASVKEFYTAPRSRFALAPR